MFSIVPIVLKKIYVLPKMYKTYSKFGAINVKCKFGRVYFTV